MEEGKKTRTTRIVSRLILFLVIIFLVLYGYSWGQEVSTWKTYINEKYGYEIKYPPDLTIGHVKGVAVEDEAYYRAAFFKEASGKIHYEISVGKIFPDTYITYNRVKTLKSNLSLRSHIVSSLWSLAWDCRDSVSNDSKMENSIKWQSIRMGGIEAMQATSCDNECLNQHFPISLVIKDNLKYFLVIREGGEASIYNKMFPTFKFIQYDMPPLVVPLFNLKV